MQGDVKEKLGKTKALFWFGFAHHSAQGGSALGGKYLDFARYKRITYFTKVPLTRFDLMK
jgi:hypothetical protein